MQATARHRARARRDPIRFNSHVLGRDRPDGLGNRGLWARQREIAASVVENQSTLAPCGHMVGKSFLAAGLLEWFLFSHPGCLVLATAPSGTQLKEVLVKEVERAHRGARVPLGGRVLHNPFKIELSPGWSALAYSTDRQERMSGHHARDLFVIVDEASGVDDDIFGALAGLNPSRELLIGNPLRATGVFADRCRQAARGESPGANLVHVSSLESPHIGLPRSPWGLADKGWLDQVSNDYGTESLWFRCHVLGLFAESSHEAVFPSGWLDLAERAPYHPAGPRRMAIDLGLGNGGDRSVVLVRDDNGVLAMESSNRWSLEATASRAALLAQRFAVEPHRISFDVEGIGADFANRLQALGLRGAHPYRGGGGGGKKFFNTRAEGAWKFRQRLDPNRMVANASAGFLLASSAAMVKQHPFSVRPEFMRPLRRELTELRYETDPGGGSVKLENAETYAARLKHSPDLQATICQSFSFKPELA